jgi:hypothetical protein
MSTSTKKRVYTAEQRARQAAYLREYRKRNPQRVKQWRENYIKAAAARLQAATKAAGGELHAGD